MYFYKINYYNIQLLFHIFIYRCYIYFKVRSNIPWFNSSTLEAKRSTRKFEIMYLKNPYITNYKQLTISRNAYIMKLSLDKRNYYKNNIFSYSNNSNTFYSITIKLLGNESHLNYSPFSNEKLCFLFIEHFYSKVINICNKINNIVLNEDISTPSISVHIVSFSFDTVIPPSIVDIYIYI